MCGLGPLPVAPVGPLAGTHDEVVDAARPFVDPWRHAPLGHRRPPRFLDGSWMRLARLVSFSAVTLQPAQTRGPPEHLLETRALAIGVPSHPGNAANRTTSTCSEAQTGPTRPAAR